MSKIFVPLILILFILNGCATVGPDYIRPEVSLPSTWQGDLKEGVNSKQMDIQAQTEWWSTLNDPQLTSLIERSINKNLSLQEAKARLRQARARLGISRADLLPSFDLKGSALLSRDSKTKETSELYKSAIDSSWELDIFGGNRRSLEASKADLDASVENVHDVLVSLRSEIALNYISLRTYQSRLAIAEANLSIQNETYQISNWRHQAGLSSELALEQARYNLESTRSQIPNLKTAVEEAMNRLALLLGEQPGSLHRELTEPASIPLAPSEIALGIPADILRQRPDIRRAERELAAQTARVGAAMADLYPKFSLSGSIGLESLSLGNLLSGGTKIIAGSSLLTLPIFRGGAIRQNIELQSALQEQALIKYESAILNALEEVENAIIAYTEEQKRRDALQEAENAAMKAAQLAMQKYTAGLSDFNDVLESQRSLLSFQDQLAQSNGNIIMNLIRLYKALGGGWKSIHIDNKEIALDREKGDEGER